MADFEKTIKLLETAMNYNSVGLGRIVVHHETLSDALELLKSQQERIDNMRSLLGEADEEIRRLKAEAEKAFISGQNNMLEAQAEGR